MNGMYIGVSETRIIHTAAITCVEEFPPENPGEERALVVSFAGASGVTLRGEEADIFLRALPVYVPTEED